MKLKIKRKTNITIITGILIIIFLVSLASALRVTLTTPQVVFNDKIVGDSVEYYVGVINKNNFTTHITITPPEDLKIEFKDDLEFDLGINESKNINYKIILNKSGDYFSSIGVLFEGNGESFSVQQQLLFNNIQEVEVTSTNTNSNSNGEDSGGGGSTTIQNSNSNEDNNIINNSTTTSNKHSNNDSGNLNNNDNAVDDDKKDNLDYLNIIIIILAILLVILAVFYLVGYLIKRRKKEKEVQDELEDEEKEEQQEKD